ncbi:unnamed protein product [Gongylonema pulchrum]|uniref:CAP_N domain-containing protein n=1 Tax=Gongylonema pulchrum TaxID=637853 RepID=A0A183DV96_9BILA|nr:unnamed protein product [Gongylonema pulchrum]
MLRSQAETGVYSGEPSAMNNTPAGSLEKLVQRLETATLRLEALSSQKPALAPKPASSSSTPACGTTGKLLLLYFRAPPIF